MIFTGDIAQPFVGASSLTVPEELQSKVWIGNLEGSLINEKKQGVSGVYNDDKAIDDLQLSNPFNGFSIANNHLLDAADVCTTIENLQRIGIQYVGGGTSIEKASQVLTLTDVDGATYRILAFGWENIQCVPASKSKQGVNPYFRKNVIKCVKRALKNKEPLICFFHWNYELEKYPQPYDRKLAMDLIDMGVDVVIGCHAHRVQPIEFYKGKPIVYGLGNFLFCQGYYFNGKLRFPKFCAEEYAFEITQDGYTLHYFNYDQEGNKLNYVKSSEISADKEFDGRAVFTGYSDKEYEQWFKKHRVQKKLLPVFYSEENDISYWLKSKWIKTRGSLINLLTKMNIKSANRENR